ncbi:hypothetical protein P153DRAFT_289275, partial [Dothidotthia symphoricarpi CBS 119687]
ESQRMVSYPDSQGAERSLAIRRPPSVAGSQSSSRTSTVRRHRTHRSHFGGTSLQPQNEFPVFTHTGDMDIAISNGRKEQRYLLHKLILTQCSGFFEAGTSDEWATAGDSPSAAPNPNPAALARVPPAARQEKKKWRYELDWGKGDHDVPMLVQKKAQPSIFGDDTTCPAQPPPARNKPPAPQAGFFRTMANFSTVHVPTAAATTATTPTSPIDPDDDTFRDYDNLFRIFYNYAPTLDVVNIANAYVECKSLLQLADMYDAVQVIGPRVDHHLLRFQGRLWKQIAKYPPSYLKLGYMARSKAIFAEAMVHVVGQWPSGLNQLRGQIADSVIELIEDKVDEVEELKAKIEVKLFRLSLTTSRGERVSPSSNWLDWLAVSLFRQWLAENTTPPPAPILKSPRAPSRNANESAPAPPAFNTGRVFRLLGQGGSSYLNHDECKRFLRLSQDHYNRENLKKFERRVEEIKNKAKDAVKPLMRNFLELDLREGGLPYLTCARIDDQDFPWEE